MDKFSHRALIFQFAVDLYLMRANLTRYSFPNHPLHSTLKIGVGSSPRLTTCSETTWFLSWYCISCTARKKWKTTDYCIFLKSTWLKLLVESKCLLSKTQGQFAPELWLETSQSNPHFLINLVAKIGVSRTHICSSLSTSQNTFDQRHTSS